jgi:DNA polymerase
MIVAGDYETYYDKEYSLSKMSEVEYILDARFQAIMLSLKVGNQPSEILIGEDQIASRLATLDWENVAWLSHNTRFDGSILAWHFGYVPKMYLCSLSMARATTHWTIGRSSLAKLSEYLGLPPKGDEVLKAQGKRLEDFTPEELQAYADYCIRDNENARAAFDIMRPIFGTNELILIDLIMRMFILPQVQLNTEVLQQNLADVIERKQLVMADVESIPKENFSSNIQFAELLEANGVEVPKKVSPTTGEEIPALSKNDWDFKELLMDDSLPLHVQAILAARVAVKSTLEETRSANLLRLSRIDWPTQGRGWAPVPLKYSGARTHRLSGDGGLNWQNFMRGSLIRQAIEAPPGHRVVHRDASQIEARMTAWLARCEPLLHAFKDPTRDPYSEFATIVYNREITREDKLERFVGKTGVLSLGYGSGPQRFRQMLFIGNGGISLRVHLEEAARIVYTYRDVFPEIPHLWAYAGELLIKILKLTRRSTARRRSITPELYSHIPVKPEYDSLLLPSGLRICYPNLRHNENEYDTGLVYDDPYSKAQRKIYGAKAVENISQALARIIVTDIAVRVRTMTGYHPFLTTHDSLDYCVPDVEAEEMDAELERQFALVPEWAPGLPLASEGGWGRTLRDAEKMVNA